MRSNIVISGCGLWKPAHQIHNDELVDSYNRHAERFNSTHAEAIEKGEIAAKPQSSSDFITKASGIESRYVYTKDGILDIERMKPLIPPRGDDELSVQAEMAVAAAKSALKNANKLPQDIDAVIVACSYTQRSYPAIAIEVQHALGIQGFGFDMLVACSAATFGLHRAYEMLMAKTANAVLVINPELTSPQVNFADRDSHFIFGDVAVATVLENADTCQSEHSYAILSTKAVTHFSNNIRSNFGYLSRANDTDPFDPDALFHQNGRKVFKEVCPMAADHISDHLAQHNLTAEDCRRWWLHQANLNMNQLISKRLLGRDPSADEAPTVLNEFANTASAGSLVAFYLHHQDLVKQDIGVICSFGAGYSIGSLVIQKR